MTYNHGSANSKFEKYLDKRKKKLRKAGCPEKWIHIMEKMEREDFNRERRFYEHQDIVELKFFEEYPSYDQKKINTIKDIFETVPDGELLEYLEQCDLIMLTIILMLTNGYDIDEIADELKMTANSIYKRVKVFRKNLPHRG